MLSIDHEHVEGWSEMSFEEKSRHFRGLLCLVCNRWRVGKNTLETAKKVVAYLER